MPRASSAPTAVPKMTAGRTRSALRAKQADERAGMRPFTVDPIHDAEQLRAHLRVNQAVSPSRIFPALAPPPMQLRSGSSSLPFAPANPASPSLLPGTRNPLAVREEQD